MRALFASLLVISAVSAQSVETPAPASLADVWLSFAPGVLLTGAGDAYDSLYGTLALQAATGPRQGRVSYSETAVFQADLSGLFASARAEGASAQARPGDDDPTVFRTVHLAAGPRVATDGSTLALIVGPALTYGDRRGGASYSEVGGGMAAQAMLRLAGPIWVGAEGSAVLNPSASHAGLVGLLRVDLARAAR